MIGAALRRYRKPARGPESAAIDERPRSAYELVTRQMLADVGKRIDAVDTKINGLLLGMLAVVLTEVYRAVIK